ncbi:MAG: bifunctional diaminohydroxyphosphoribosylaminopyrimidine deaminase/5-amino-6-(5-phosphoribosylamino)uracil reductase RibD [Gammaproteobacteria bacterium]
MSHSTYMAWALQLAAQGLYTTQPNPRVGCVLVKHKQIIAEGWHRKAGEAHAEIHALNQAGNRAKGATAYVTLEPCSHHGRTPPCADALVDAGVSRVVIAMEDPNPQVSGQGVARLREAGIEVITGVLEAQARELNPGFIKRMSSGLPYVRVKLAMSLDGRTAMASGESQWITGSAARKDVQKLRARSSAILTGIATIRADDPSLNVRMTAEELGLDIPPHQPMRVILDSQLSCPHDAKLFSLPGQTVILTSHPEPLTEDFPRAEVVQLKQSEGRVDLHAAMQWLATQEINEVHVEAGSVLCGALLESGLVDELVIYMAPHLMGNQAKGLFHLPDIQSMERRLELDIKDIRMVGQDVRITALPK